MTDNRNPGAAASKVAIFYLASRESKTFDVPSGATVEAAIDAALAAFPDLTPEGFGGRSSDPFGFAEVATAIAFLRRCKPKKVPNRNSYALKHAAERWGRRNGMAGYVSNGALILVAVYLGFTISDPDGGPNVFIGVGRRSVRELEPEVNRRTGWL